MESAKNIFHSRCLYYGIVLIMCGSCRESTMKVKTPAVTKKLEYLIFGLPPAADRQNAEAIVADRWGFSFKTVGGCVVTEKLTDSVAEHNHQIDLILERTHGKDWYTPFKKEVDKEMLVDKRVIALLSQEKRNINKANELITEDGILQYTLYATTHPLIYKASAEALKQLKGE